jgi:hypothetical protein
MPAKRTPDPHSEKILGCAPHLLSEEPEKG